MLIQILQITIQPKHLRLNSHLVIFAKSADSLVAIRAFVAELGTAA